MRYVLAVDAGTTSVRSMLFGRDGSVLASSQRPLAQHYPGDGMVEHDAAEIWRLCRDTVRECLSAPGVDPEGCVALGITNQRETTVVWDRRTGEPLCGAIVWQDRRTHGMCEDLIDAGMGPEVLSRTGLRIDAYFSGTKLRWVLDNVPGAREGAERGDALFGTVESWLIWKLTGGRVHATDWSNASRTMMFDIHRLDWSPFLLDMLGVPRGMLPEAFPPGHVFGTTDPAEVGVSVPIAAAIGDQQSALLGQTCLDPGDVKITFGTGGFLLMNLGHGAGASRDGLLTTVAWESSGRAVYALEGSIYIAGAAVQWLRDELGIVEESSETERMALGVEDTCGCYVVPAFTGLGAPHWVQNARGVIMGLTRATNRCHIARAALESIAYQANDVIRAMESASGTCLRSIKVDGGASANGFLCQFLADITGMVVERPRCIESTALGAAYAAGLTVGFWEDGDDLRRCWELDRRFVPSMDPSRREGLIRGWEHAVRCARLWSETS